MNEFLSQVGLNGCDAIILLFLLVLFFIGIKRGFVRELAKLISLAASFIVAKIGATMLEPMVFEKLNISNNIHHKLASIVSEVNLSTVATVREDLEVGLQNMKGFNSILKYVPLDKFEITDIVQKGAENMEEQLVNALYTNIEPLLHKFLSVFVFVVAFFVLLIIFGIITRFIASAIESLPLIGSANALLGGIVGIVKGIILVSVFLSLVYLVLTCSNSDMLNTVMESKSFMLVGSIKDYLTIF